MRRPSTQTWEGRASAGRRLHEGAQGREGAVAAGTRAESPAPARGGDRGMSLSRITLQLNQSFTKCYWDAGLLKLSCRGALVKSQL